MMLVRAQPRSCSSEIRYLVRMEPGVQTARRNASARACGSCRDTGWLLCRSCVTSGSPRASRRATWCSSSADVKPLDGPGGYRPRLHRPARLVRGVPARGGLDRARSDLGAARRRGSHPARVHAPSRHAAPRDRLTGESPARVEFSLRDDSSRACTRTRASPSRTPTRSGRRSTRSASGGRRSRGARRAPDAWAASRRSCPSTTWRAPSGTPPRSARRSASSPRDSLRRAQGAIRARRLPALRPGQVVPRRAAAALGARAATGDATASRYGRDTALDRRRRASTGTARSRRGARFRLARSRALSALTRARRAHRLRGRTALLLRGRQRCRSTPIRSRAGSRRRRRARSARAISSHGLDDAGRLACCPLPPRSDATRATATGESSRWPLRRERLLRCRAIRRWACGSRCDSLPWRAAGGARSTIRRPTRSPPETAAAADAVRPAGRRVGARMRSEPRRGRAYGALTPRSRDGRAVRLHAAARRASKTIAALRRRGREAARAARHAGRRRRATRRRAIRALKRAQRDARPGRDRGQHPSRADRGASCVETTTISYEEARADAARHREVHARRPPHRHRRRQPRRARRRDAPPTARSCAGPICCGA